jgi:hypothetical protein
MRRKSRLTAYSVRLKSGLKNALFPDKKTTGRMIIQSVVF